MPTLVYINQRSYVLSRRGLQLKYRDENQKYQAQSNSCALYKILKPDVQLILDNENYFSLNRDISCTRKYYTTDRSTAPPQNSKPK